MLIYIKYIIIIEFQTLPDLLQKLILDFIYTLVYTNKGRRYTRS